MASDGYGGHSPLIENTKFWFVYLLKCNDGTFYTGCTSDLNDRMKRHNRGEILYTKSRLPFELHNYFAFNDKYKAYAFEKYLKSGSGKAFSQKRFI
ncbi:MAG: GIY-YIG nuclease family protein [Bacteroidetes bacterium]|nr:GIY-YIG nuclease family protein [Bacteroidota bacterium]